MLKTYCRRPRLTISKSGILCNLRLLIERLGWRRSTYLSCILRTSLIFGTRVILISKTALFTAQMASNPIGVPVPDSPALYWSWAWPTLLRNFALKAISPRKTSGPHLKGLRSLGGSRNTRTGFDCYSAYVTKSYS